MVGWVGAGKISEGETSSYHRHAQKYAYTRQDDSTNTLQWWIALDQLYTVPYRAMNLHDLAATHWAILIGPKLSCDITGLSLSL